MNPYPVVIKYVLNGKPESMRLDPYEKRLNELHIKNPNKTQPTLEFQAFDEKTQQPLRINGRASMLFKPNKYRSKVFLMVGKPLGMFTSFFICFKVFEMLSQPNEPIFTLFLNI